MKTIAIVDVGANKVKAIEIYRDATNVGVKEAKDAMDEVENGLPALFEVEDSAAYDIMHDFEANGILATIDDDSEMAEAKNVPSDIKSADIVFATEFEPIIPASEVTKLEDRDLLKKILVQVAGTIKTIDDYSSQIEALQNNIEKEKVKMEEIRKNPPLTDKERKLTRWIGIGGAVIGFFVGSIVGTVVVGIGAFVVSRIILKKYIVRTNPGRCNDAAYQYSVQNIRPLEDQLTGVHTSLNRLAESGQVAWAIDVVGEDMFDTESVNILYQIIDGRRADTMKEALNKYDEEMYRRNMQAMQLATQQATEAAAAEAEKQTNALKNIEKSSKQTAKATQTANMLNILEHSSAKQQKKLIKQWKKDGLL